jgi:hypothetical protein
VSTRKALKVLRSHRALWLLRDWQRLLIDAIITVIIIIVSAHRLLHVVAACSFLCRTTLPIKALASATGLFHHAQPKHVTSHSLTFLPSRAHNSIVDF